MTNSTAKSVKIGYRYGLIMFISGALLVGINVVMIYMSDYYYPKLLAVGMAIALLSPIFFIFPGASVEKMPQAKEINKVFWKTAPGLHKAMWITWGIVSIAIAVFALISFDPEFYQ